MTDVTLADVFRARQRIASLTRRTPLVRSSWLSDAAGADVRLKLESLQVTGSFKVRGAVNCALALKERLGEAASATTIVTASAGNAGRALAYAAEQLGLRAIVFTPRSAPRTKLDAIKRHGAELRDIADDYEHCEHLAKEHAATHRDSMFLSPYSDPVLIAGIGTIALEVFEDYPEVDTFVVPVGGGGLISGIALAAKAVSRKVRVIGVEAAASQAFAASVRAGRITEVPVSATIADGLAGNMDPDTITFDIVRQAVDELAQASEEALYRGIRGLVEHEHLIAEGAGIAAVAALLSGSAKVKSRNVVAVVSGSNIDVERLREVLAS